MLYFCLRVRGNFRKFWVGKTPRVPGNPVWETHGIGNRPPYPGRARNQKKVLRLWPIPGWSLPQSSSVALAPALCSGAGAPSAKRRRNSSIPPAYADPRLAEIQQLLKCRATKEWWRGMSIVSIKPLNPNLRIIHQDPVRLHASSFPDIRGSAGVAPHTRVLRTTNRTELNRQGQNSDLIYSRWRNSCLW